MTSQERARKLESYRDAHTLLVDALDEFPKDMWQFRDEHGCWSIHEHIVHITDSEANSYIRCRRIIAEQGESLMAYDENQWAAVLDYHEQSVEDALALFKWLRHKSYTLIKDLPEPVWAQSSYHPENGENHPRRLAPHLRAPRPRAPRIHAPEPRSMARVKSLNHPCLPHRRQLRRPNPNLPIHRRVVLPKQRRPPPYLPRRRLELIRRAHIHKLRAKLRV